MIWLKKNRTLTSHQIEGDKEKVQKLIQEYSRLEQYKLVEAWDITGGIDGDTKQVDLEEYIEYKHLGHNGNGAIGHICMAKKYLNPKAFSLLVLNQALNGPTREKIYLARLLGKESENISTIEKLLVQLDTKTSNFVISKLWEDFYFFATEVLQVIELKEEKKFDIDELESIKALTEKCHVDSEVNTILNNVSTAESNSEVLQLARKIKK